MTMRPTKDEQIASLQAALEAEKAKHALWHQAAQSNYDALQKMRDWWAELWDYVNVRADVSQAQVKKHDLPVDCARLESWLKIQGKMRELENRDASVQVGQ